jgi:hypothetical protein
MNTQPNDGGPAFPQPMIDHPVHGPLSPESIASNCCGMSLRDVFAVAALQGIISNQQLLVNLDGMVPQKGTRHVAAYFAYACADAMIEARERKEEA